MTDKRSIYLFWALFLVPTLIMAAIAFKLLSHEQERMGQAALQNLAQRGKTICDTIHLTVEAVQENLGQSLLSLNVDPDPDQDQNQARLEKTLVEWERTNPLVRNVFIYQEDQGLDYPPGGPASTREERGFIARYEALFSGRIKFDGKTGTLLDEKIGNPPIPLDSSRYGGQPLEKTISSRQKLVALSRVTQKALPPEPGAEFSSPPDPKLAEKEILERKLTQESGWIPWFSENRLSILGWAQQYENGPVYGVELELMSLLSRLIPDIPELSEKGAALVLMDGNKTFMHQSGSLAIDPGASPAAVIPVSNLLPHWQMGVFVHDKSFGQVPGFLFVSIMLLAIFIGAMVSGGVLLTRMSLRNMKDARQKTSFVSSVSHELKTPLTSIRMYAELLLSKRITDENKIHTYLSVIVGESGRLTRLINNVLDFGRLEQGRKTYLPTFFDLDRFLNRMIQVHGIRIQEQGLEIITRIEPGDYSVRTDQDAMEQVVLNLIDNALKYAGHGKFIKFVLERQDAFILLKVCDDGPGIPREQQERIFEKFHRMDNSLTSKQPGSGLGLSIARQILRDLDGDLLLESHPGNGACFTARIKYHDPN